MAVERPSQDGRDKVTILWQRYLFMLALDTTAPQMNASILVPVLSKFPFFVLCSSYFVW
jgi:hypothetical protein